MVVPGLGKRRRVPRKLGGLKTTEVYSLLVLEAKSKGQQG